MPPEEWRPVPGHPGYEVSADGRVRFNGEIRKTPVIGHQGYRRAYLVDSEGRIARPRLHRLVCEVFHGPAPEGRPLAAHNDGDVSNNAATNVRWASAAENAADRRVHGTAGRKLDEFAAEEIRRLRRQGLTLQAIGNRYGIGRQFVHAIVTGNRWRSPTPSPPAHPNDSGTTGPGGAFFVRG